MTLVLASGSPRRRELIGSLGLPFRVEPSTVEERSPRSDEPPDAYALALAGQKAAEVAQRIPGHLILAADTVVAIEGDILGKPANPAQAVRMLTILQGRQHSVITAVVVLTPDGRMARGAESAAVWMRPALDHELRAYVAGGEPLDKAGAYAVQGEGRRLVERVEGCYETVVGLPLCLCRDLLAAAGVEAAPLRGPCCTEFEPAPTPST